MKRYLQGLKQIIDSGTLSPKLKKDMIKLYDKVNESKDDRKSK